MLVPVRRPRWRASRLRRRVDWDSETESRIVPGVWGVIREIVPSHQGLMHRKGYCWDPYLAVFSYCPLRRD